MAEEVTDEVKRGRNEIADLQREMEAKDKQLRAQGEEIQMLRQRVKEKEQEIEEKVQSIEDFHKKVEQRDKQLEYLKKPPEEVELSPKALEEYDKYFDHVLKLTEELSDSEATIRKQQRELEKLQKLVDRTERMEEQVIFGTVELSEKEQQIKELREHVQARDEELELLRQQVTGSGVPLSASLKFDDLPPGTDPRVEIAVLKQALENKEIKVESLCVQVQSFEAVIKHTKEQSKQVIKLKQELSAIKKEKETLKGGEIPTEDVAELLKLREEIDTLRKENDNLKGEIEALKTQAILWEEDFKWERHDREQAAGRFDEDLQKLKSENKKLRDEISVFQGEMKNYQQVVTNFEKMQRQLVQHKEQMADMEQLFFTKQREYKTRLEEASRQLQEHRAQLEQSNGLQRAQLEVVQRQLSDIQKLKEQKAELSHLVAEKEALLQAAQAEQLQLRQLTQEKDRFLQGLLSEKDQLRQRVSALTEQIERYPQQLRSQHPHQSDFWEVPRNEITLNMHKILGIGAWGYVVEGRFRSQKVAVKCLHDMIRQPEVIATIRKEIGIMAQIRHPNLVLLIAAVIDGQNDPLIVTELLDVSLRKAYENHLLQGSSLLSIFRDVASALNYLHLHQRGEIIHRDVSSANVLLEAKPNDQWKAKLSDFGSAKLAVEAKTTGPGAPAYTAPEVRKEMGIPQTAKLDVYSYGVLLCEVIVGQFPVDGSFPSMMETVRSRWPFMHGLVTSCIQNHPDNRPTMSNVLGEFDKLQQKK